MRKCYNTAMFTFSRGVEREEKQTEEVFSMSERVKLCFMSNCKDIYSLLRVPGTCRTGRIGETC